jgi:hypothetical protein
LKIRVSVVRFRPWRPFYFHSKFSGTKNRTANSLQALRTDC